MDSRKQQDDADRQRRTLRRPRSEQEPENLTIASGTIRRGVTEKLVLLGQTGTSKRPSKYIIYTAKGGEIRLKFADPDGKVVNDYSVSRNDPQISGRAALVRKILKSLQAQSSGRKGGSKIELRESAFEPTRQSDATLRALERGRAMVEQDLVAAGGTYSTRRVAEHLQISPQAVDKQRKAGKLFAVRDPEGHVRFPAFQFTRPAVRPHLARVLNRLRTDNSFVKLHWLLTADSRLGNQKPIDLLDHGDVDPVLKAAEAFGEHVPG